MVLRAPQLDRTNSSPVWRQVIVFVAGGVTLTVGLVMLVLPGPAIVFIPLGLAILATEFRWARKWLSSVRQWFPSPLQKITRNEPNHEYGQNEA
jgi:uncharacterized protein (TIGR02611 family)